MSYNTATRQWTVFIYFDDVSRINLGGFDTFGEALRVYQNAESNKELL